MKKVFKIDSFVDFSGKSRQVIMAAISQEIINDSYYIINYDQATAELFPKVLRLGVAVQNPKDEVVNTELGKVIAEGKALKDKSCIGKLYSTDKGFINNLVVNALLDQEMDFFKQNPGKYIKGYNKDKELYTKYPILYLEKINKK